MIFKTMSKFAIAYVWLIFEKDGDEQDLPGHDVKLQTWNLSIKVIAVIFDKISKQQVNLSLFLSDWYCQELRLTTFLCQDGKSTSNMTSSMKKTLGSTKIILQPFSMIFKTTSKFVTNKQNTQKRIHFS